MVTIKLGNVPKKEANGVSVEHEKPSGPTTLHSDLISLRNFDRFLVECLLYIRVIMFKLTISQLVHSIG